MPAFRRDKGFEAHLQSTLLGLLRQPAAFLFLFQHGGKAGWGKRDAGDDKKGGGLVCAEGSWALLGIEWDKAARSFIHQVGKEQVGRGLY